LKILEGYRIVERDPRSGRYHFGLRIFERGTLAIASFNIRERAARYIWNKSYMKWTRQSILFVLDAWDVLYLDKTEPKRSDGLSNRTLQRSALHSCRRGDIGIFPKREVNDLLLCYGLQRFTPNTITTPVEPKAELRAVVERGYSIDNEEVEDGVRCAGAAMLGHSGCPLAAISSRLHRFDCPRECHYRRVVMSSGPGAF